MSLKCLKTKCSAFELASPDQLAFYQGDNGGWNLALGPEFKISKSKMPKNIRLLETPNDKRISYEVICTSCMGNVGKVNKISGFSEETVNFSAQKTTLVQTDSRFRKAGSCKKWSKIVNAFPQIRKIFATKKTTEPIVGSATVHFNGSSDLQRMVDSGKVVAARSNMDPRRCQWRGYFFSCINNTLLCLPTGMGKTLIASMLMCAYRQLNPNKGQVFVVPTVGLVSFFYMFLRVG